MNIHFGASFFQSIILVVSLFILVLVIILIFKGIKALNIYIANNEKDSSN